jgi:hypothetical protein
MHLVFKVYGSLILNLGKIFELVSLIQSAQHRIPTTFIYFDKAYILNH